MKNISKVNSALKNLHRNKFLNPRVKILSYKPIIQLHFDYPWMEISFFVYGNEWKFEWKFPFLSKYVVQISNAMLYKPGNSSPQIKESFRKDNCRSKNFITVNFLIRNQISETLKNTNKLNKFKHCISKYYFNQII